MNDMLILTKCFAKLQKAFCQILYSKICLIFYIRAKNVQTNRSLFIYIC